MENKNYERAILIICLVIITCLPILYFSSLKNTSDNQINPKISQVLQKDNIIPNTDYTCEEIIPKQMTIVGLNHPLLFENTNSFLENDIGLSGWWCEYNMEVGQKASQFWCKGIYHSGDRISEEGIILQKYWVEYEMLFDDENCTQIFIDKVGYLVCDVLDYSCKWEYYSD